ncbi:MAG: hypothetical protein LBD41_03155 [Clostridiales Family XIII bacterium]|jgi:hypothetical protein|nr:hypothetical protein [Clostridiales Family XIII bacterium]
MAIDEEMDFNDCIRLLEDAIERLELVIDSSRNKSASIYERTVDATVNICTVRAYLLKISSGEDS